MPRVPLFAVVPALVTAIATGALPRQASADPASDKAECVTAYEGTQRDRKQSMLRSARAHALACSRAACPAFIVSDCSKWLAEIDTAMPSVVVTAKSGNGDDITDVTVYVDDVLLMDHLTGLAVNVDPGSHTFRLEYPDAQPVERRVVIREGEKSREIAITFPAPEEPAKKRRHHTRTLVTTKDDGGSDPMLAYVIGGAGLVALGSFGYFAATGVSDEQSARSGANRCAPNCPSGRVDSIRRKYLIADISLGVGVACVGLASYLLIHDSQGSRSRSARSVRFDVVATGTGAVGAATGRF